MSKDKLRRFREFTEFTNTFDFAYNMKGVWSRDFFKNDHPLVLELGCGKGEYTVALARSNPAMNFVGIDLKSNRMWKGAGVAMEEKLTNVCFMRAVVEKLTDLFAPQEADEIWITFPDPFPKDRHAKHRLTSPGFLARYREVLKPGGTVHFKTDDAALFAYTLETLNELGVKPLEVIDDVHGNPESPAHLREIITHYEKIFMAKGLPIRYTRFRLS